MNKVLVFAALLMMFTAISFAQDISLKNVKLYGQGSVVGISVGNGVGYNPDSYLGPQSNYGRVYLQSTLGVMFDLNDNIQAAAALCYENSWSELGGDSLQTYLNTIRVIEANLTLNKLFNVDGLSAKVGRQYYGDEDSTVMYLGIRHNAEPGDSDFSSIDAVTVYYDNENLKANIIYGVMADNNINGNESLAGFDFRYLKIAGIFNIQAYMYEIDNYDYGPVGLADLTEKYGFYGIKPSVEIGDFVASFEVARNYGGKYTFSNDLCNSNLILVNASYNIKTADLTTRGAYALFGGNSNNVTNMVGSNIGFFNFGNFTPGFIYGEQISEGVDEKIINIGADYKGIKDYTFTLDYYNASQRDGNFNFGNEIDAMVDYQFTNNTDIFLVIAHLFKGDMAADISKVMLGATYKIM